MVLSNPISRIEFVQQSAQYLTLNEVQLLNNSGQDLFLSGNINTTATTSSPIFNNNIVANCYDKNPLTFAHTTNVQNAFISLKFSLPIDSAHTLLLTNRVDQYASRNTGVIINLYDSKENLLMSHIISSSEATSPTVQISLFPNVLNALGSILFRKKSGVNMHFATVDLLSTSGTVITNAFDTSNVIASSVLNGDIATYGPQLLFNNSTDNFYHTGTNDGVGMIHIPVNSTVDRSKTDVIRIHNRKDCCRERAEGVTVVLYDFNGQMISTVKLGVQSPDIASPGWIYVSLPSLLQRKGVATVYSAINLTGTSYTISGDVDDVPVLPVGFNQNIRSLRLGDSTRLELYNGTNIRSFPNTSQTTLNVLSNIDTTYTSARLFDLPDVDVGSAVFLGAVNLRAMQKPAIVNTGFDTVNFQLNFTEAYSVPLKAVVSVGTVILATIPAFRGRVLLQTITNCLARFGPSFTIVITIENTSIKIIPITLKPKSSVVLSTLTGSDSFQVKYSIGSVLEIPLKLVVNQQILQHNILSSGEFRKDSLGGLIKDFTATLIE